MKKFRLVDNVMGWVIFVIAAFTYCSTIEPTASFWDCPEFITTAYMLEIGHPPGAPFFALTANLFTQFASSPENVAMMVNTMSALLSALCIMFLFWTISHLSRKLIVRDGDEVSLSKLIAIEGSAVVGALIYCWSDTFWFSAVEGEVYAYSSAFTAIVFWLILKWEDNADKPHSDRWLVLITFMMGLSIGVHLLNLLCIPAMVLVFYYKKVPNANLKGSLIALLISFVLVAAVLYGVVPGIVTVGGWFELFFTNTLGLPFNTGTIVYLILLVATMIWAIWETYQGGNTRRENIAFICAVGMLGIPFYGYGWSAFFTGIVVLAVLYGLLMIKRDKKAVITSRVKNTALLCMLMLLIGYSSYALIVIRSTANPPMDQNSPEDIFTLGNYLSRDQYGDRPLLYGQAYTSQPAIDEENQRYEYTDGAPVYERQEKKSADEKDSYFISRRKSKLVYAQNMFFPRMYDQGHASQYEQWMGGIDGHDVDGVKMPTQVENMRFFFSYQCNFMYWRYFMWNFAGRQNDIQGNGELEHGNWITGIPFIDNFMYGDQSKLPDELKAYDAVTNPTGNKGHNVFYCLPLLLGILGLFWQAWRGKRGIQQFWVVFFLFFMTGLAIVIYLNQTPGQPRERDYAYAGSFYAFAIWCGLGVTALYDWVKKLRVNGVIAASVVSLLALLVPIQMVSQTWDDHDRSGRYTCRDFGQNYLNSMQAEGNPIIFTNGDNDTFPLWYNQDVEGVRRDARVCNLSYLQTDWYIDQMKRPAYSSPSVPITWPRIDYLSGTNEALPVRADFEPAIRQFYKDYPDDAKRLFGSDPFELKNVLKLWVEQRVTKEQREAMEYIAKSVDPQTADPHVIPTDSLVMTIDKNAVKKSGMLIVDTIPDKMLISLNGHDALYKSDLMMLEMIAHCNWTRPLYVAITVGSENFMNLGDNFIQEGLANRITPFRTANSVNFDVDRTYNLVMNKFRWGGLSKHGLYLDETVRRMCATHRRLVARLANILADKGEKAKAAAVLAKISKEMPAYSVPLDYLSGGGDIAKAYAKIGQKQKAASIYKQLWKTADQYMTYYMQLDDRGFNMSQDQCLLYLQVMQDVVNGMRGVDGKWAATHYNAFARFFDAYQNRGGTVPNY